MLRAAAAGEQPTRGSGPTKWKRPTTHKATQWTVARCGERLGRTGGAGRAWPAPTWRACYPMCLARADMGGPVPPLLCCWAHSPALFSLKERGSRACPRLPLVRSTPPTGSAGAAQRFGLTSGASGGPLVPEGTCPMCRSVGQKRTISFLFLYPPSGGNQKFPLVRSTPPRSSAGAAQRFGRAGKGVAKGGLWRDAFGFGGAYWGKRRNISDGWAGVGSPQKPYPLPAVCLGRRLTVIDVRPALAVTEATDGHGRNFSRVGIAETGAGLDGSRPRETGTTGIA